MLKKKIAVVNIFFPPKALGGATRIVVDEVTHLFQKYGNEFEVVVFTADTESPSINEVDVYNYNGYRVYAITVPLTVSTNWQGKNEEISVIFEQFLDFEKPDLVHFHCIQALSASILEVTQIRGIPNVVTVHDAWWISDHQFLIDQDGGIYPNGHPDPFQPIVLREGVSLEESLARRIYLKGLLQSANIVLAVSEKFTDIYRRNGVLNVKTNKNGISNSIEWREKSTQHTKRVICAHVGGMSEHKGFDVFKDAIFKLERSNIEVIVVDHTKESTFSRLEQWGHTDVRVIGLVSQADVVSLYCSVDVIFAPSKCAESFGLVTREAAACGCWVVGSNVGAIGEDIRTENGFVIPPTKEDILSVLRVINRESSKFKGPSKSSAHRYSSDQVSELVEIVRTIVFDR